MTEVLVAIDPGDRWCGVAFFTSTTPEVDESWVCTDAQEWDPEDLADGMMPALIDGDFDIIVMEEFRLYEDKAAEQTGSEFLTSQLIGVVKWQTRAQNTHAKRHQDAEVPGSNLVLECERDGWPCANPAKRPKAVTLAMQPAAIKTPTRGILKKKKIKSVARPIAAELYSGRAHIVDAELHGWHYLLKGRHRGPVRSRRR